MNAGMIAFFCLFSLVLPINQKKDESFLDLTKKRPPEKLRLKMKGGLGGGVGMTTHTPSSDVIPLKITLLSLDKQTYQLADKVMYQVMLENITNDVLVIPWSADYDRVRPDEDHVPSGYIHASLSLLIRYEIAGEEFIAVNGI